MEKSIGNVKLFGWLAPRCHDGENSLDHGGFHNRRECFPEIDASLLSEPANHPSSLIALQSAIRIKLMLENPFPSDNVGARWPINQVLGTIAL